MSSTYGENLKLSIFGQSHSPAVGMVLDGIPAGLSVDPEALQKFLDRRAPGNAPWSTARKEEDRPEFLGGIVDGFTCGAPIAAVISNQNAHASDYDAHKGLPRPGHADYTAQVKYGGFQDASGGGHFSGRLTAPLCIAGGLCKQWLKEMGIEIGAHIEWIHGIDDEHFDPVAPQLDQIGTEFPVLNPSSGAEMVRKIDEARQAGNSVGGIIECAVTGIAAGIGEPMFGGVENRLSQILYGIPAVKGVEFGCGFAAAYRFGSENNDSFYLANGQIKTNTNHCGGILGGITTGMPIIFRVAIKPTPSISLTQTTVDLRTYQEANVSILGRHDPCIVPRAVPVVEAAAAIALYDMILGNTQTARRKV